MIDTPSVEPIPLAPVHVRTGAATTVRAPRRVEFWVGTVLLAIILVASVLAPWIAPFDPIEQDLKNFLQPPSAQHWMGTDNFGRDIFSRVLHAAKLDLQIGFFSVLFPMIIGVFLGALAGYWGGFADTLIMRTVDVFTAFPFLVLVIGIIAILGPGLLSMYIALTLAGWTAYARIVRGEILVARKSEYVLAAQALGYDRLRVLLRHILPNVITPAIIFSMADIVLVILSTTALSFLGLGVQPPTPEWGSMIAEGRAYILSAWWLVTMPGLAIVLVAFALSLFGDGVADMLRTQD